LWALTPHYLLGLRVYAEHFFPVRVVNEHKGVTANTIVTKVGHRKRRLSGDGCIKGISACF
jgi:hypothetical protein